MYFIFGRIIKNNQLYTKLKEVENINDNFDEITILLKEILCNHVCKNSTKSISYNEKEICSICFEEFGNENVKQCSLVCKNIFHTECLNLWLSHNNSCPLCRSQWVETNNSPLDEFANLSIG